MRRALPWLAVATILLTEDISVRRTLDGLATAVGAPAAGGWDIMAAAISDPYALMFVWVPTLLVMGTRWLAIEADYPRLVRQGSRTASLVAHILTGVRAAILGLILLTLCAATVAVGRDFSGWGAAAALDVPGNEVLRSLSASNYPVAALAEQWATLLLLSVLLLAVQGLVRIWSGSDSLTAVASALLFVGIIVSFKAPWPFPEAIRPVNLMAAYHAHMTLGSIWPVLLSGSASLAGLVSLSWVAERRGGRHVLHA